MLLKMGVDISRLDRPCRRSLATVEHEFSLYKEEPVITSTYEGNHWPSSLHYANQAYDVRRCPSIKEIADALKISLGKDFDIVLNTDHLHIEYDPK